MIFLRNDNKRTYFKSTIETFSEVKRRQWPTSADILYNKLVVPYIYFSIHDYRKVPKFLDARNFAVIYLKFIQRGQTFGYYVKKIQRE